jgi:hypothetical protein
MDTRFFRKTASAFFLLILLPWQTQAASTPPKKHIHFQAEHLAEESQDALYFAMPWPNGDYSATGWRPLISVGGASVSESFATADGRLLTLGLGKNWANDWTTELVVFDDRFHISGGQSINTLLAFKLNNVPLDLPGTAIFSNPGGEFIHTGAGINISHRLDIQNSNWQWDVLGSLLFEKLDMKNYTVDYTLTDGADAGASGVLDHSGNIRLDYVVMGIQARKSFADRYIIIPRLLYGRPKEAADMVTRLTGPGFELTTESTGADPGKIGDGFGYAGLTVRDSESGFEMDLGSILGYHVFEYLAREGNNKALILSLTWRR